MGELIAKDQKKDNIKLTIPSKAEYVSVIRLTASSIASKMGFNIDQIDDIKVAIAEACTNAMEHGLKWKDEHLSIDFTIYEDRLCIVVKDTGTGFDTESISEPKVEELRERGLGIFIIKSLMDEVDFISEEGKGTEIRMIKKIEGGI